MVLRKHTIREKTDRPRKATFISPRGPTTGRRTYWGTQPDQPELAMPAVGLPRTKSNTESIMPAEDGRKARVGVHVSGGWGGPRGARAALREPAREPHRPTKSMNRPNPPGKPQKNMALR